MEFDYHDYGKELKRTLESIKNSDKITKDDKEDVLGYYEHCLREGRSISRMQKVTRQLCTLAQMKKKSFRAMVKKDVENLVGKVQTKEKWSDTYKRDFKGIIKIFFRWLRNIDKPDYPEEVKWITGISKTMANRKLPQEMLTEDDIKKLANAAEHPRDRAFLLVLYESGCRIGEMLQLKIKNIQFDKYGAVLLVNGKTGHRRVRIIASTPVLAEWLNIHPHKANPDDFVWTVIGDRNKYSPLKYNPARYLLLSLAKRAKIKKAVNPHNFRHSRATHLAALGLNNANLKAHFGWRRSEMADVYIHLAGKDIDDALLKINGLVPEEKVEEKLKIQICQRCQEKNSPAQQFCGKCGSPLNLKIALDYETKMEEADNITSLIIKGMMKEIEQKYDIDIEKITYEKIKQLKLESKLKGL